MLSEIVADPSADAIWAVSDGRLLRIALDGSAPRPVAGGADPKIASIVWPQMDTRIRGRLDRLIVGVPKDGSVDLYAFDVASGSLKRIERPSPQAELAVCSYDGSRIAFKAAVRDGTFLWISDVASGRATKVLETNAFLREIAEGTLKPIAYRSSEGEDLKGWVLLPPGYREGERYPTIVEVYAGYLYGDKPPYLARLNLSHALNHQLLAAHGYAVLFPSMPLSAEGTASDPYMELSKGVLPAVDRAIELGYTDPKRLGVMGQSFGGFSTYGLVTQTRRFGAAISMAGLSDFISLYGVLDARVRYTDTAEENLFQMALFETGQTRMGNPPWKDIGRYLRNSPLFYVDRVQTPLMIIQGDMDYVAMQQGEQFFTALYRQGKRAELVRYWGEGRSRGTRQHPRHVAADLRLVRREPEEARGPCGRQGGGPMRGSSPRDPASAVRRAVVAAIAALAATGLSLEGAASSPARGKAKTPAASASSAGTVTPERLLSDFSATHFSTPRLEWLPDSKTVLFSTERWRLASCSAPAGEGAGPHRRRVRPAARNGWRRWTSNRGAVPGFCPARARASRLRGRSSSSATVKRTRRSSGWRPSAERTPASSPESRSPSSASTTSITNGRRTATGSPIRSPRRVLPRRGHRQPPRDRRRPRPFG